MAMEDAWVLANAITQTDDLEVAFGTYGPMWLAGTFSPSLIKRRLSWLYGADVTQP